MSILQFLGGATTEKTTTNFSTRMNNFSYHIFFRDEIKPDFDIKGDRTKLDGSFGFFKTPENEALLGRFLSAKKEYLEKGEDKEKLHDRVYGSIHYGNTDKIGNKFGYISYIYEGKLFIGDTEQEMICLDIVNIVEQEKRNAERKTNSETAQLNNILKLLQ